MARQLPPAFLKKKKKALPFQGKVVGAAARKRPDRAAAFRQRGGTVAKADADLLSPTEANAPAGGAVRQKFQDGGEVGKRYAAEGALIRTRRQMTPPERKDGGDTGEKWIGKARASMERRGTVGSLRKAMGAKEGQKIPTGSLQAKKAQAKRTGNTAMMRKVQFALNVRK